ncbi:MAG: hypothetical protein CBC76_00340 [Flavobacteriaceae bacterium TMED116]|nr:MAG: hypothetical protein CBC76_00340 [Flavobacteriaceae bacterium TMED116]
MKNKIKYLLFVLLVNLSCDQKPSQRYVPDSSGNINSVTIVMSKTFWNGELGEQTRNIIGAIYEGLPIDEPLFDLKYIEPKLFNDFARQSRNIIEFAIDSTPRFTIYSDPYAKPQVLAEIKGLDSDEMIFLLEENNKLIKGVFIENEVKEKRRRISKALSTDRQIQNKFNFQIKYPSAYKLVKDTINFIWLQKPVMKGHLNLIAYTLAESAIDYKNISKSIIKIRDSIGKTHIPGRLKGSYMITEKAYRPYYYKTTLENKKAFLTKGTWEVANDYMAGPFVNYIIEDKIKKRLLVIEGFAFAPSVNKRDYMFELETIIKSFSLIDMD